MIIIYYKNGEQLRITSISKFHKTSYFIKFKEGRGDFEFQLDKIAGYYYENWGA